MKFHVIKEIQETNESKTLHLQAEDNNLVYNYKAGQHCVIEVTVNGTLYKRSYSFSQAESDDNSFQITIKKTQPGIVSNYLVDTPLVGQEFNVSKPFGFFQRDMFSANKPIVLIGAGSGITPLYTMLTTLSAKTQTPISLLYFNRSTEQTIFYSQLKQLSAEKPQLNIQMFASDPMDSQLDYGRIDPMLIKQHCPDIKQSQVAICGPLGFMQSAENFCKMLGVNGENIHQEHFVANATGTADTTNHDESLVKVNFSCMDKNIFVPKNSTLLEVAEQHDIYIPNECCIGSCGECKVKLNSGQINMQHLGGLNPRDESNGYILSCCSQISQDISIQLSE